jgi:hypothetical protein
MAGGWRVQFLDSPLTHVYSTAWVACGTVWFEGLPLFLLLLLLLLLLSCSSSETGQELEKE